MKINLNKHQMGMLNADEEINVFVGGLGCGKTFTLALKLLKKCSIKGSFGLLTAPVSSQLSKYTLREIQSVWTELGLKMGIDYVMNTRPPKEWAIEPYSMDDNRGIITLRWGSYIQVKESFNFDQFRGSEFDYILFDELREIKEGAFDVLLGRLRGKCFKELKIKHTFDAFTTPPDNITEIKGLQDKGALIFESKTADNLHNLPKGYIELQKSVLDDRTYRREVMGEMIPPTLTLFYNFTDDNLSNAEFQNKPTVLSFDFNVSPMSCLVFQDNICVKEFQIYDSNSVDTALKIREYLLEKKFNNELRITGDASGLGRSTQNSQASNNFDLIEDVLREFNPQRELHSRRSRKYGENCISSAFRTANGIIKLKINKKECNQLYNNILTVTDEDYIKKDPKNKTHNIDALRYYCVHFLPTTNHMVYI